MVFNLEIFNGLAELLLNMIIALVVSAIVLRTSHLWLGIDLIGEVKEKNKAAAFFSLGLMVMLGVIVGLFKV